MSQAVRPEAPRKGGANRQLADWRLVALALVASLAVLWLVTKQPALVAAFAGGVAVLSALARTITLRRPAESVEIVV